MFGVLDFFHKAAPDASASSLTPTIFHMRCFNLVPDAACFHHALRAASSANDVWNRGGARGLSSGRSWGPRQGAAARAGGGSGGGWSCPGGGEGCGIVGFSPKRREG